MLRGIIGQGSPLVSTRIWYAPVEFVLWRGSMWTAWYLFVQCIQKTLIKKYFTPPSPTKNAEKPSLLSNVCVRCCTGNGITYPYVSTEAAHDPDRSHRSISTLWHFARTLLTYKQIFFVPYFYAHGVLCAVSARINCANTIVWCLTVSP